MCFAGLITLLRQFDKAGWKGAFRRGNWSIGNGGYDLWFELYYKGEPVAQCIAGTLSSEFGLEDAEKENLLERIVEVYDNLTIQK